MSDLKKEVRRLPPCPAYDVEGMESWLTGLAREEGLLLAEDGIFAGVATFEKGELKQVKYRLDAAPKSTSLFSDNGGGPDPEAVELNRAYHWDYVAKRGDFYIYRTDDPTARELNTDPEVQAMAINAVKKRRAGNVFYLLFWLAVYPVVRLAGGMGLLRAAVGLGTWFCLWAAALMVWALISGIAELVHLNRLIKKLKSGGTLEGKKPRRGRIASYQVENILWAVLGIAWVIVGLNRWAASEARQHQLSDFQGAPPFATIADFGGAGLLEYREILSDLDRAEEWSDWLAPRNIDWSEHAGFHLGAGASETTCRLRVEYHQMAAPFLARWMAWELERDHDSKYYRPLELPPLDADYAAAFMDLFPTVVLQKGDEVVRATFYQNPKNALELEEWAAVMAESLGQ